MMSSVSDMAVTQFTLEALLFEQESRHGPAMNTQRLKETQPNSSAHQRGPVICDAGALQARPLARSAPAPNHPPYT